MKATFVNKIYKNYLKDSLSNFGIKGRLIYNLDLSNDILRGFYFEDSAYDPLAFVISVFCQPLYMKADTIFFNFGKRLGGKVDKWWNINEIDNVIDEIKSCIIVEGLTYLNSVKDSKSFIENVLGSENNCHYHEAIALSSCHSGCKKEIVLEAFDKLLNFLSKMDLKVKWIDEMYKRNLTFKNRYENNPFEAKQQLDKWILETKANLKI